MVSTEHLSDAESSNYPLHSKEIVVQVDAIPVGLNPYISPDIWCQRITFLNIFEPLVRLKPDASYAPHLAREMQIDSTGREYVFHLRSGIHFHDGRPLTSLDVKFTLEKLASHSSPSDILRLGLSDIDTINTPNDQTIALTLRRPNYLLPAILAEIGILPAHLYARYGLRQPKLNSMPVGTGPFRVTERTNKDVLILERNDKYWGPPAKLEHLVFQALPGPGSALAALRNGEIDVLPNLYPGYYPDQINAARLKERYRILRLHPYRMRVMFYNVRHPLLRDRRVRLALERLADRDRIVQQIRHGLGKIPSAPLWLLSRWYDSTIHPYSYDRAAALKLLEAAGCPVSKDNSKQRFCNKTSFRLKILRSREAVDFGEIGSILRTDLQAVNIGVEVEAADFGFIKAQMTRERFDVTLIGLAPWPESDLSPFLHSKGELNHGGYSNSMVDAVLDSLRTTSSPEHRLQLAQRLHRLLHDDPPFSVLYVPIELMIVNRNLKGLADDGRWPDFAKVYMGVKPGTN